MIGVDLDLQIANKLSFQTIQMIIANTTNLRKQLLTNFFLCTHSPLSNPERSNLLLSQMLSIFKEG